MLDGCGSAGLWERKGSEEAGVAATALLGSGGGAVVHRPEQSGGRCRAAGTSSI